MKRVAIFGNAGGGKSTLARELAAITGLPLAVIDELQYRAGGAKVAQEEFLRAHAALLATDEWIIDGFGDVRLAWERFEAADTLVHVDLPLAVHFLWVTKRLVKGLFVDPPGWPEGSPILRSSLSSYRVLWPCHTRLTPRYRAYLVEAAPRKRVVRLRSRRELQQFVASLRQEYARAAQEAARPSATTAGGIRIRPAIAADAERLATLAERTFRDTFGNDNSAHDMDAYVRESFAPDRVRAELADSGSTFLLAFADAMEGPIGYAKLRTGAAHRSVTGANPVELQRLYVARSAIGQGVGAALVRASLAAARSTGHRTIWLGVWERNASAISFYERWAFRTVGEHVFRLGADEQRDLVMERPVPEPAGDAQARP